MISGKELILATKPFAVEDRRKSWYYTLSTLFLLVGSLLGTLLMPNIALRLVCSILAGLFTIRMFVIYHDFMHHTILHKSHIANAIFTVFGMYMMAPTSIWKRSHDYHHKHNSKLFSANIGSYPIATLSKYKQMTPAERRKYLISRHPITIAFGYFSMFMFGMAVKSFRSSPKKHMDSLLAIVIHVVASILVFVWGGWVAWLLTIIIPYFIPCTLGAYLFYAQHNFPGVVFADNASWKYEEAALKSSSFMKMSPLMNWLTANIGYHHIHHLNSRIPFYRLPEVLEAFPELQQATTTSLKPKDVIACFRLKVWDPESNQMIGFKQMKLN